MYDERVEASDRSVAIHGILVLLEDLHGLLGEHALVLQCIVRVKLAQRAAALRANTRAAILRRVILRKVFHAGGAQRLTVSILSLILLANSYHFII